MCGIVGLFNLDGRPIDLSLLTQATTAIRHRGPDDEGYLLVASREGKAKLCGGKDTDARLDLPNILSFASESFDFAFGFRRLSIQDVSPAGHQPMASADRRYWVNFNGEIYNFLELRIELISKGHSFHTGTDTEVILAAYEQWGDACLERFNGMFAFAIWDTVERTLFLARDRFGEKPVHYVYVPGKVFAFASEMKSLWAAGVPRQIHRETLALFEHHNQVDIGDQTFYAGIKRLPQAHSLRLKLGSDPVISRYWDIDPRVQDETRTEEWYADQFRELLTESVKLRLRADVPVGSSLSGGLDSSTIVTVINRLLPSDSIQKTFSARFDEAASDEGKWIDLVTAANRVQRFDVWPQAEDFFADLSRLFWHQEEPFTSTSIYAQYRVMGLARENDVTVLLDGQGADEMLAGYHSYFDEFSADLLSSLNFPAYLKSKREIRELHGVSPSSMTRVAKQSMPRTVKQPLKKAWRKLKDLPQVERHEPRYPAEFEGLPSLRKLLWWNTTREGLVELLRYADRNSMAHSREVRLPFLDHNLVEFVFRLPDRFLIRNGWTKWILREAFRGIVPAPITDRVDKLGYMPPQKRWLADQGWQSLMLSELTRLTESGANGRLEATQPDMTLAL
ncbi:MAG TPA: asparagine synthase (glutamine-hydrolyzing) [Pyrinomonadaceae bacterium]|nr:asparagine synthase (glutamine-hydrolyzing) [Pyrinomonadaceae bacterium]